MRQTSFTKGVEKLALNLYNIVRDTSQIKAHEDDVVMLVIWLTSLNGLLTLPSI